jgi:hypothetical protein
MPFYAPFVVAAMARQSAVQQRSDSESLIQMCRMTLKLKINLFASTAELHLSGLICKMIHPEMQKSRIIGFFSENKLYWQ